MNAVGDASIVEFRGKPNGHKPCGPERLTRTQLHLRARS